MASECEKTPTHNESWRPQKVSQRKKVAVVGDTCFFRAHFAKRRRRRQRAYQFVPSFRLSGSVCLLPHFFLAFEEKVRKKKFAGRRNHFFSLSGGRKKMNFFYRQPLSSFVVAGGKLYFILYFILFSFSLAFILFYCFCVVIKSSARESGCCWFFVESEKKASSQWSFLSSSAASPLSTLVCSLLLLFIVLNCARNQTEPTWVCKQINFSRRRSFFLFLFYWPSLFARFITFYLRESNLCAQAN